MMVISAGVVGFNGLIGWGVMRAAVTSPAIQRNSVAFLFRLFFFRSDQFEWNGGGIVWAGRNGLFHPPPPPAALHQMTTDAVDADGSQSALKSRFNFIKFHWVVDSLIDAGSFEGRPINSWRGRWEAGGKGGCSELVIIKF